MPTYGVTLSIADGDGGKSSWSGNVVVADQTAAEAKAQLIAELIDPMTGGAIVGASLSVPLDTTGWTVQTVPDLSSDVEVGGRFMFGIEPGDFTMRNTVPTFNKNAHTVAGSSAVNLADPVIAAFITQMIDGGWKDSRGGDVARVKKAYETFGGRP